MLKKLNDSQQVALAKLSSWWGSPEQVVILNAPGGYGKTYLVNYFLKKVNAEALLLAPTHEALAQLRESIDIETTSMTVHASLGIRPTMQEGTVEFKEGIPHQIWGDVNLIIVDESSMLSQSMLDRIIGMGKKVLFLGHDAQLPPIAETVSVLRKVESPIFTYTNVPKLTLTIPMRNGGELHKYLVKLEALVKCPKQGIRLPSEFEVKKEEIERYIRSTEGKDAFMQGYSNIIAWTNSQVSLSNAKVRQELFGEDARNKYVVGDKVILTKPVNIPDGTHNGRLSQVLKRINAGVSLHTNTPGTVVGINPTTCTIDGLSVSGLKLRIETALGTYDIVELEAYSLEKLSTMLEHRAWGFTVAKDRHKAYKDRHDVLSSFGSIQHSYAVTAHRAQGRTIENVIVMLNDILKNPNRSEALRCWYTAASRASKRLMIYTGVS